MRVTREIKSCNNTEKEQLGEFFEVEEVEVAIRITVLKKTELIDGPENIEQMEPSIRFFDQDLLIVFLVMLLELFIKG